MKLAEALILRSDLKKRLEQIKSRMLLCVKVQEGETPPEDPATLAREFDLVNGEFTTLVNRINRTNVDSPLDDTLHLYEALALRDRYLADISLVDGALQAAMIRQDRTTRSEVRYVRTIDVAEYQSKKDLLSKQYRELDARIQEMNWKTELL